MHLYTSPSHTIYHISIHISITSIMKQRKNQMSANSGWLSNFHGHLGNWESNIERYKAMPRSSFFRKRLLEKLENHTTLNWVLFTVYVFHTFSWNEMYKCKYVNSKGMSQHIYTTWSHLLPLWECLHYMSSHAVHNERKGVSRPQRSHRKGDFPSATHE